MVLGSRNNEKRMEFGIPAGPAGEDPGLLCLESSSAVAGVHGKVYLWADSNNDLRFGPAKPADENVDGSLVGVAAGSGANAALSNLASIAINTTLVSDTTATDDLGTSSVYWRAGYLATLYLTAEWHI